MVYVHTHVGMCAHTYTLEPDENIRCITLSLHLIPLTQDIGCDLNLLLRRFLKFTNSAYNKGSNCLVTIPYPDTLSASYSLKATTCTQIE